MKDYKISLTAARVNAGLSQSEIADKMGVSRQTIANWESGTVKIKTAQLKMYCELCKAPRTAIFLPGD